MYGVVEPLMLFLLCLLFLLQRCVNKHTLERKAVKIINKKEMRAEEKDMLAAEIAIMKLVNHPNIIRMEAVYESKEVRQVTARKTAWPYAMRCAAA